MKEETMIHPETGEVLHRDIRPIEFTYKGEKITVDMPGWYPKDNNNGIFTHEDMKISEVALDEMLAKNANSYFQIALA